MTRPRISAGQRALRYHFRSLQAAASESGNEASWRGCVLLTNTPEDNAAESEGTASAIRHAKEQHDIDEAYRNLENTGDPWLDPWDEDPDSGE